ncbi:MAG: hypothetical protein IPN79_08370 [Saprospiraceae bacterium]|nr:hypothetical protein [Saprospiraceae bacterium]
MALDRTGGFDLLVQLSESEINEQIAAASIMGTLFPTSINIPIASPAFSGSADINFGTPTINFDPAPRVELRVPFSNSQLNITAPIPLIISPLGGMITITDTLEVVNQGSSMQIAMNFNNGTPTVTVAFDASSAALLAPLLAAAGMTLADAQNIVAGMVLSNLQTTNGGLFALSPEIPVADDNDPTTIFNFEVRPFNDNSALDRDCLSIGIRMSSASGGNINLINSNMLPPGVNSMVMMSNFWLLSQVMRRNLATALGISLSDIDTPFRLNRPVPAPGGEGTLTRLEARVDGNRIRIDGRAIADGTGWSAESNFHFFVELRLVDGSIAISSTVPVVDTDIDLEWWVWLAAGFLGGLFGGIIGAIVAIIVTAIVESVAEGIVNNLVSEGISGGLGDIPSIPLGPIGSGFSIDTILLDDLELRCSIFKALNIPIKHQGQYASRNRFGIDLETGAIRTTPNRSTDLIWDNTQGISIANTAGLRLINKGFNSVSPLDISRLPLTGTRILPHQIPMSLHSVIWFLPRNEIVFGIRTAEGRLGKVRASINLTTQNLELEWVIYDTPIPSLDLDVRWYKLERGNVNHYITDDCKYCTSAEIRWRGVFTAKSKLLAFPVNYQWCLCGQVLDGKEGVIEVNGEKLKYTIRGNQLILDATRINQSIKCQLCISAIDFKGREFFKCIKIDQAGLLVHCRRCEDKPRVIDRIDASRVFSTMELRPLELTKHLIR